MKRYLYSILSLLLASLLVVSCVGLTACKDPKQPKKEPTGTDLPDDPVVPEKPTSTDIPTGTDLPDDPVDPEEPTPTDTPTGTDLPDDPVDPEKPTSTDIPTGTDLPDVPSVPLPRELVQALAACISASDFSATAVVSRLGQDPSHALVNFQRSGEAFHLEINTAALFLDINVMQGNFYLCWGDTPEKPYRLATPLPTNTDGEGNELLSLFLPSPSALTATDLVIYEAVVSSGTDRSTVFDLSLGGLIPVLEKAARVSVTVAEDGLPKKADLTVDYSAAGTDGTASLDLLNVSAMLSFNAQTVTLPFPQKRYIEMPTMNEVIALFLVATGIVVIQ